MEIREEIINRMLRILKQFSRKLKIALYLPMIVDQLKVKSNAKEIRKINKLCMSINLDCNQTESEITSLASDESKQIAVQGETNNLESQCAIVLHRLLEYEDDILLVVKDNFDLILPSLVNAIDHVEQLQRFVDLQVKTTPKQLREREIQLRNSDIIIVRTGNEIKKLSDSIDEKTSKHNETIKKFKDEVDELNHIIDDTRRKHRAELDRELNRYETKLRGLRDDIIEEKHNLDIQLHANEELMEKLIQANLEREKSLRKYCIKTEKEYLSAKNAYDRDLNKLNELKETLEMQLHVTKNHFEILQNEYDVQSVLFTNLRKERELAMMQAFAEQLDNFEKNRAARIIQRTWRAYRERVTAKKKKKKKNK